MQVLLNGPVACSVVESRRVPKVVDQVIPAVVRRGRRGGDIPAMIDREPLLFLSSEILPKERLVRPLHRVVDSPVETVD